MHPKISILASSLVLSAVLCASALADNSCPSISVPPAFTAHEKFFAIGTDLTLKEGRQQFGKIDERILHLTPTFDIQNAAGQTVARAHQKLFSWGTQVDIFDCNGTKLGTVKEQILKSLFHPWSTYEILDPSGRLLASSKKMELLATNFSLETPSGVPVGSMHRPWINLLTDKWEVTYNAGSGVDPRLWLTIPAYKTAADNARRAEEQRQRNNQRNSDSESSLNETRDSKAVATQDEAPSKAKLKSETERAI